MKADTLHRLIFIEEGIFTHELNGFFIECAVDLIFDKQHEVVPRYVRLDTHNPVYKHVEPHLLAALCLRRGSCCSGRVEG